MSSPNPPLLAWALAMGSMERMSTHHEQGTHRVEHLAHGEDGT